MRRLCGADEQTLGKGCSIGGEALRLLPVERVAGAFVHDKPRTRDGRQKGILIATGA